MFVIALHRQNVISFECCTLSFFTYKKIHKKETNQKTYTSNYIFISHYSIFLTNYIWNNHQTLTCSTQCLFSIQMQQIHWWSDVLIKMSIEEWDITMLIRGVDWFLYCFWTASSVIAKYMYMQPLPQKALLILMLSWENIQWGFAGRKKQERENDNYNWIK